jgi:hypothetical protein
LVERGREGRGGEFDQSTLDAYMEKSQWNPFVQLIFTNKNNFKKKTHFYVE